MMSRLNTAEYWPFGSVVLRLLTRMPLAIIIAIFVALAWTWSSYQILDRLGLLPGGNEGEAITGRELVTDFYMFSIWVEMVLFPLSVSLMVVLSTLALARWGAVSAALNSVRPPIAIFAISAATIALYWGCYAVLDGLISDNEPLNVAAAIAILAFSYLIMQSLTFVTVGYMIHGLGPLKTFRLMRRHGFRLLVASGVLPLIAGLVSLVLLTLLSILATIVLFVVADLSTIEAMTPKSVDIDSALKWYVFVSLFSPVLFIVSMVAPHVVLYERFARDASGERATQVF